MARRGVSLLEVMFAIGVIAVGLLGVVAVLPLALSQVGRGNVADRSSRVGLNAVAEFDLRGMRNPSTWRTPAGGTVTRAVDGAFCIDPLFVAANGTTSNGTYNANVFPYFPVPATILPLRPRMSRISLYSGRASFPRMTVGQAEQIFVNHDQLAFELPKDETLPPIQIFGDKRQSEGFVSWMATVAPKIDNDGRFKDTYTLSIVVFNRRDVASLGRGQTMFEDENADGVVDPGDAPTYNERLVWILGNSGNANATAQFHGDGYGGGDVTFEAPSSAALAMKSGDWVMLMQNLRSTAPYTPMFRWYRITETEPQTWDGTQYVDGRLIDRTLTGNSDRPGLYERDATLIGSDWPWLSTKDRINSTAGSPLAVTYATLVTGVVAVYEKTIRMETSSLW